MRRDDAHVQSAFLQRWKRHTPDAGSSGMAEELMRFHSQRVGTGARQDLRTESIGLFVVRVGDRRLHSDTTERLFEVTGAEPRGANP